MRGINMTPKQEKEVCEICDALACGEDEGFCECDCHEKLVKKPWVTVLLIVLTLTAQLVWACDKGCFPFEGICACDQQAYKLPDSALNLGSNEKPPRGAIPSWQTGDVQAAIPKSLVDQDTKMDQEYTLADLAGKKAAGLVK